MAMFKKLSGIAVLGLIFTVGCNTEPGGNMQPLTCDDGLEPNNERTGAKRLDPGSAQSGLKVCPGDEDWYVVAMGTGDNLKLNVDLTKYVKGDRPADALVVTVHESTQGAAIVRAPVGATGADLAAELQPGDAGDYYIHVKAVGEGVTQYDLSAVLSAPTQACPAGFHPQNGDCVADGCSDLGFEPNESPEKARVLLPGRYTGLKICSATDQDFFVIAPPAGGGAVTVSLNLTGKGGDLDMYVTDGTLGSTGKWRTMAAATSAGSEDYITNLPVADTKPVYLMVVGDKMAMNTYDLDVIVDPINPKRDCLVDCGAILKMDGAVDASDPTAISAGYYLGTDEEYTYARRDLAMLLQYAFDEVLKKWPGTPPVYQSDIGQADGKTPGVDVGQPRHPTTTHIKGRDCDVAYYSTLGDNDYRIICGDGTDTNGNGRMGKYNDGYFCTTDQNVVDFPKQTYFIAMLMGSPMFRVLGVDETLPDRFVEQADKFVASGELPAWAAYKMASGLGYGNDGGWAFHHHHIHLSLMDR
jgi:hypothetical protein